MWNLLFTEFDCLNLTGIIDSLLLSVDSYLRLIYFIRLVWMSQSLYPYRCSPSLGHVARSWEMHTSTANRFDLLWLMTSRLLPQTKAELAKIGVLFEAHRAEWNMAISICWVYSDILLLLTQTDLHNKHWAMFASIFAQHTQSQVRKFVSKLKNRIMPGKGMIFILSLWTF